MRWLTVVVAFFLLSCAHRVDFGPTGRLDDPHEILSILHGRYERVTTLRGEGRLSIDSPRGSGSLRFALDAAKPDSLYLETADILGIARGTFATDGDTFAFYDPGENVFYQGPAHQEILGRFLPVALPPNEIVALLLGQPELLWEAEDATLEVEEDGFYRLELRQGQVRQRVRVATRDLRLVSVQTQGKPAVEVQLSEHAHLLPDLPFPERIDLVDRRSRTSLRVRYREILLDEAMPPESFVLQPPPGARIVRVDG